MLTCQEVTEVITDYLEGRMPFSTRMSFRLHIGMCGPCRRYLRQMKLTIGTLADLPRDAIPSDVKEALQERFKDWKKR